MVGSHPHIRDSRHNGFGDGVRYAALEMYFNERRLRQTGRRTAPADIIFLAYRIAQKSLSQPISKFQAVAFKLADSAVEIECARNLLYKACWLKDQNRSFEKESAMAKLYCSEVMGRVSNHAVQIHGGYGLMKEYNVERFYRDQKLLDIGEGTSEVQRIVISRYIGC